MSTVRIMMPTTISFPVRAGQRGMALLEILGALAIGAILLTGLATVMDGSIEDVKGQQAAYYQSQIVAAGQKYIAANSGSLKTSLPSGSSLVAVGVPDLIAGHFLSANTAARNVYGQTPCVLVRQPDPVSRPGQFDALVVTSGGQPIPDRAIAMVAANAGPGGGYIAGTDPAIAKGAAWSSSTSFYRTASCAGGSALSGGAADAGHLASNLFYDGPGQVAADFLYRDAVPGHPELNRMNTPIRMAGTALVSMGASCLNAAGVPEAGVAIDTATRGLAVCGTAGVWTSPSQWKEPVASFASLPTAGSVPGDVRIVQDLSRAFSWNGSNWVALAVDENGNLDVPGMLTAKNVHATQDIAADGTMKATGDISTRGSVQADLDVNATRAMKTADIKVTHNVVAYGVEVDSWMSTPAITVANNTWKAGYACNYEQFDPVENKVTIQYPYGTVVTDANHVPLICGADNTMKYANGTYFP